MDLEPAESGVRSERVAGHLQAWVRRALDRLDLRILAVTLVAELIANWVLSATSPALGGSSDEGRAYVALAYLPVLLLGFFFMVVVLGIVLGLLHRRGR